MVCREATLGTLGCHVSQRGPPIWLHIALTLVCMEACLTLTMERAMPG